MAIASWRARHPNPDDAVAKVATKLQTSFVSFYRSA
jgi:hypothetical protein